MISIDSDSVRVLESILVDYTSGMGVFRCLFLFVEVIKILIFGYFLMPDYHHEVYKISEFSNDVNGETKETQPIYLGRFLCQLISQQNSVAWPFAISGAGWWWERLWKNGKCLPLLNA